MILANIAPELRECLEMVDASKDMWHDIVKAIDKKNGKEERTTSQQRLKTMLSKSKPSAGPNASVWQSANHGPPNSSPGGGGKTGGLLSTSLSANGGEHR